MVESLLDRIRILLSPADGGAVGGTEGAAGESGDGGTAGGDTGEGSEGAAGGDSGGGAEKPAELPKFAFQLSPDRKEKYKAFLAERYSGKTLNDVIDDLHGSSEKMKRALFIPDREKPDPEEMKAFLNTFGIPETADGYELKTEKAKGLKDLEVFVKDFKAKAHGMGLNNRQAQAVMDYMVDVAQFGSKSSEEARAHLEKTFDDRLAKAAGSAEEAAKTRTRYTKFLTRFADDPVALRTLETSGLIYSETFAKRVAEIEGYLADNPYIDGGSRGRAEDKGRPILNYGDQFKKTYGGA